MPPDQNQQHQRRPHYHRGRRGPDRRGGDRRPQQQPQQTDSSSNRDQLDVEQIMREIRSRISEKHGIDLTTQQIQDLAARRLEAILDPRATKPSLMDELRRASGLPADVAPSESEGDDSIDESALYASKSGFLNSIRRLFSLLNPKAIVDALNALSRKTKAVAAREAELRRRQTEWNALHFEILRRLVTDIARAEIDNQHLAHRVESLQARVDFNERRVRGLESTTQHQPRPVTRPQESPVVSPPPAPPRGEESASTEQVSSASPETSPEGVRRRRRRRRGRRSGQPRDLAGAPTQGLTAPGATDQSDQSDQSDQGSEGDDFSDEDGSSDDFSDDVAQATPESAVTAPAPFEPPPSVPEEPVHVAHLEEAPVVSEITPAPEPVASGEPSDPLTREQS
jgi:hypothetical protein